MSGRQEANRFTALLSASSAEAKPAKRKGVDFGEALAGDFGINETFKQLHKNHSTEVTPPQGETVTPQYRETVTDHPAETVTVSTGATVTDTPQVTATPYIGETIPLSVRTLTPNQAFVLDYLITNKAVLNDLRVSSNRTIAVQTAISQKSVEKCRDSLTAKGFIVITGTIRRADFQGFSYVINQTMCDYFKAIGGIQQSHYIAHRGDGHPIERVDGNPSGNGDGTHGGQGDGLPEQGCSLLGFSEPLKPLKPTTLPGATVTPQPGETVTPDTQNNFVLIGPVGLFWENEGLDERQCQIWLKKFDIPAPEMRLMLDWARFDLEVNGKRKVVRDPSAVGWFYGVLVNNGGIYSPRPKNYQSAAELRAAALREQQSKDLSAQSTIDGAGDILKMLEEKERQTQ
jgi:hypothetical protein